MDETSYPGTPGPCVPLARVEPALFNHLFGSEAANQPSLAGAAALARIADLLRAAGRCRVANPFRPPPRYPEDDGTPIRRSMFVDLEPTGSDAVIRFAAVLFEYAPPDGRIFAVGDALVAYEDPGRPIVPEPPSSPDHGRRRRLRGRRIDDHRVPELAGGACLAVPHSACDRRFLDRRLPCSATRPPGLLARGGAVKAARGVGQAGVPAVQAPQPRNRRTRRAGGAIRAEGHATARSYRWLGARTGARRRYIDIPEDAADAEREWLGATVYRGAQPRHTCQLFDERDRHSDCV